MCFFLSFFLHHHEESLQKLSKNVDLNLWGQSVRPPQIAHFLIYFLALYAADSIMWSTIPCCQKFRGIVNAFLAMRQLCVYCFYACLWWYWRIFFFVNFILTTFLRRKNKSDQRFYSNYFILLCNNNLLLWNGKDILI